MKRRDFVKTAAASTLTGVCLGPLRLAAAPAARGPQEYYELRRYRLKTGAKAAPLEAYLEKALVPTLNRLGSKPIGVFTEIEPKESALVFVLIPHRDAEACARTNSRLLIDREYLQAGADYLQASKENSVLERMDSWLLEAFAGMPRIELPAYSKAGKARLFEMRTYESYSEPKAAKKVDMFNDGEIDIMREVGLAPIFYGAARVGPDLPHLTYMTSAENEELHKQHWADFVKHPSWDKMKNDPQYAETVSKITKWMLRPLACSQI